FDVQVDRPVEKARAGQAGAVLVDRVERPLPDPFVAGQTEVVVGAEHDPARGEAARGACAREPWRRRRSRSAFAASASYGFSSVGRRSRGPRADFLTNSLNAS